MQSGTTLQSAGCRALARPGSSLMATQSSLTCARMGAFWKSSPPARAAPTHTSLQAHCGEAKVCLYSTSAVMPSVQDCCCWAGSSLSIWGLCPQGVLLQAGSRTLAYVDFALPAGSLMLGQRQGCLGGCFSPDACLAGDLADVRIWSAARSQAGTLPVCSWMLLQHASEFRGGGTRLLSGPCSM